RQGEPISAATRSAFQAVFEGRVREVLEHTPPSTVHELEGMASRMIEQHLERRLRSSAVFAEHIQL
ncbi:MAG: hypothetical protein ACI8TP_004910, partial [Acidimicrobiales bacterium]